jgi:hypothetical protein
MDVSSGSVAVRMSSTAHAMPADIDIEVLAVAPNNTRDGLKCCHVVDYYV